MSGMAWAYYEECTRKYLRTVYEETPTGWLCKCGATFTTNMGASDHKCQHTHPWLFVVKPEPVLIPITWPTLTATAGEKK